MTASEGRHRNCRWCEPPGTECSMTAKAWKADTSNTAKTAQCVGPLGLFLVLTIADRGLSAPAGIMSALRACPLAGSHWARLAVFTLRAAIPIS